MPSSSLKRSKSGRPQARARWTVLRARLTRTLTGGAPDRPPPGPGHEQSFAMLFLSCMNIRLVNLLLALSCVSSLGACSRTIAWEEEVPLNTGEMIWVKRSTKWEYLGGHGNPFDIALRPNGEQTIRFEYGGTNFTFTGPLRVGWIAISPERTPTLIAVPSHGGWNYEFETTYYCVVPYYVQFKPDNTGSKWIWPEKIEEWLYGLPANVMMNNPKFNESVKDRYLIDDRRQRDAVYLHENPHAAKIDPAYDGDGQCPKRQLPGPQRNQ